jgi:hypothetical protein
MMSESGFTHILLSHGSLFNANLLTAGRFLGGTTTFRTKKPSGGSFRFTKPLSLTDILSFCSLLEIFCLYDVVHVLTAEDTPKPTPPPAPNLRELPPQEVLPAALRYLGQRLRFSLTDNDPSWLTGSPLYKLARDEGIFRVLDRAALDQRMKEQVALRGPKVWKAVMDEYRKALASTNSRFNLYLSMSRTLGFSYIPMPSEIPSVRNSDTLKQSVLFAGQLQAAYEQLSSSLRESHRQRKEVGWPTEVFIPPIPALILNKVSAAREIPEAMLEMREKFKRVRGAFREYEQTIRDPTSSLREVDLAVDRLKEISETLTKRYSTRDKLVVTEWLDVVDIVADVVKEGVDPLAIGKFLLGKPLDLLRDYLRNRDIIYMLRMRKRFLDIRNYSRLIPKVFGIEISAQDLAALG